MDPVTRWALVVLGLAASAEPRAQDALATPAQRYAALLAESQRGGRGFRAARDAGERRTAIEHMDGFCPKFLEVAEDASHPNALEALVEVVRAVNAEDSLTQVSWEMGDAELPRTSQARWAARVLALLLRDHLAGTPGCAHRGSTPSKRMESHLRRTERIEAEEVTSGVTRARTRWRAAVRPTFRMRSEARCS